MSDTAVDIDRFAKALGDILGEVGDGIESRLPAAADGAGKVGRKEVRRNAASSFDGKGRYAKSWGYKAGRRGKESFVEVGSTMPGLPHLLEKGHATIGGGRVEGRAHIAPAADEAFAEFERLVDDAVDEALR